MRVPAKASAFAQSIIMGLVMLLLAGSNSFGAEPPRNAPKLEDVIFDREAFISHLPKKTIVGVDQHTPKGKAAMEKALATLGKIPGVSFVMLPKGIEAPKIKTRVAPLYPYELRRDGLTGEASFLVLVGGTGKPLLIYCTAYNDRGFAVAASEALARWTYEPSVYAGHSLPVLVMSDFIFTLSN